MTRLCRALVAAGLLGCAASSGVTPRLVESTSQPSSGLIQPYVLVVAAPNPCVAGQTDISSVVNADARYVAGKLGTLMRDPGSTDLGETGTVLTNPTGKELDSVIATLAKSGRLQAGLVLLYTGHGFLDGAGVSGRSMLCLKDGPHAARQVVDAARDASLQAFPWLALMLNACESAYVDLATVPRPTAVLAASPREINVHAFPDPRRAAGSCRPNPSSVPVSVEATPLMRAAADALAAPSDKDHDRNEDGIVTIHELFHVVTDTVARSWHGCSESEPDPKLQLQARSEVPIRFHDRAHGTRRKITAILDILSREPTSPGRDALVAALRAQLDLAAKRVLPELRWDFAVIESGDIAIQAPQLGTAVDAESPCWGDRLYLTLLPKSLTLKEQLALGRFSIFSSFYAFRVKGSSVDIVSLNEEASRDKSALRTLSLHDALTGIPARIDTVDARTYRATTAIPRAEQCQDSALQPALQSRSFRVCPEEEGQCFVH